MAATDLEGMYLFANVNFVPGKYDEVPSTAKCDEK